MVPAATERVIVEALFAPGPAMIVAGENAADTPEGRPLAARVIPSAAPAVRPVETVVVADPADATALRG